MAPLALRYGATQYQVHVSDDDRYRITQMTWVPSHAAWYSYWEGPEMIEFRARYSGKYQVPIVYAWADEIASGSRVAGVENGTAEPAPRRSPSPAACTSPTSRPAQRQRQPEPALGVVQFGPEQLAQATEPVARGLRMDAESLGDPPQPALLGQPHRQRLRQPPA